METAHARFDAAHDDAPAREQAMRRGAVGGVQKPFDDRTLLDATNKALHR